MVIPKGKRIGSNRNRIEMGTKKLIFHIAITGHHSEYIDHLVDYLSKKEVGATQYFFVVHPEFAKSFPMIYEKAKRTENLYWQQIESEELNKVKSTSMVRSSWIEYNIMNRYALKNEVDYVFLLNFHTIKYAGIFVRPNYTMKSISFLQFHRMQRKTAGEHLDFYKRYFIMKWCCRNPKLKTIFILNDQETVDFMNKEFDTTSFKMLPDPIPKIEPLQNFDIFTHYRIDHNRKIFLHIGSLGLRKGTDEVIEAAEHLSSANQEQVAILLVGEANVPSDQKLFAENIEIVKSRLNFKSKIRGATDAFAVGTDVADVTPVQMFEKKLELQSGLENTEELKNAFREILQELGL